MSLDIIHPRTKGVGAESEFYEPWAERKARTTKAGPSKPRSRLADPIFVAKFKSLYSRGISTEEIARQLGIAGGMVTEYRRKLGFKARRLSPEALEDRVTLCVVLPISMYSDLKKHCGKRIAMAQFIRLACRDRMSREAIR